MCEEPYAGKPHVRFCEGRKTYLLTLITNFTKSEVNVEFVYSTFIMGNMSLSPIVLFVYNRVEHTKKTIEALKKNRYAPESELFIFSDGPKDNEDDRVNVSNVRKYINSVEGFKKIIIEESLENKGLGTSIIVGTNKIIGKYGKVIVLEDDIVTSEDFLYYMNKGLDFYENNEKIYSITGYSFPFEKKDKHKENVYLSLFPSSWGWGTWQNRWENIDWDVKDWDEFKKSKIQKFLFHLIRPDLFEMLNAKMNGWNDSWAIRWAYAQFKSRTYSVFPINSYVENIGIDGTGNSGDTTADNYKVSLNHELYSINFIHNLRFNLIFYSRLRAFCKKVWLAWKFTWHT